MLTFYSSRYLLDGRDGFESLQRASHAGPSRVDRRPRTLGRLLPRTERLPDPTAGRHTLRTPKHTIPPIPRHGAAGVHEERMAKSMLPCGASKRVGIRP
jgi:hypothetical protein